MTEESYNREPDTIIEIKGLRIPVFKGKGTNRDDKTILSFGEEWKTFHSFDDNEIETVGKDYFDLINLSSLASAKCLDVGCGSGRWSKFLAPHAGSINAVDPSQAAYVAADNLREFSNCHVAMAEVDHLPFPDDHFDFIYSLGVLHHIPDTAGALQSCVDKLKSGGTCLLYLYYSLDNRGFIYKAIFQLSNIIRLFVCRLPSPLKKLVSELIAVFIYLPLIAFSWTVEKVGLSRLANSIPLNYYRKTTWQIIRNDALDRFGTPLEQRFSRNEIYQMMTSCGLENIEFSKNAPYWHAIGRKKG